MFHFLRNMSEFAVTRSSTRSNSVRKSIPGSRRCCKRCLCRESNQCTCGCVQTRINGSKCTITACSYNLVHRVKVVVVMLVGRGTVLACKSARTHRHTHSARDTHNRTIVACIARTRRERFMVKFQHLAHHAQFFVQRRRRGVVRSAGGARGWRE